MFCDVGFSKCLNTFIIDGNLMEDVPECPVVSCIKSPSVKFFIFSFGQHKNRFYRIKFFSGVFPEIYRYKTRDIAAVTIDIVFLYPKFQGFGHVFSESGLAVIEVNNIIVIAPRRRLEPAFSGFRVPFWMLGCQHVVPAAVIRNPIEDYIHFLCVDGFNKTPEIRVSTKFGVYLQIILY